MFAPHIAIVARAVKPLMMCAGYKRQFLKSAYSFQYPLCVVGVEANRLPFPRAQAAWFIQNRVGKTQLANIV